MTSQQLNFYIGFPDKGMLNVDLQVGTPIPTALFNSISVGAGVSSTNGDEIFSVGLWGSVPVWNNRKSNSKVAIVFNRATFNKKGITSWGQLALSRGIFSIAPGLFVNTVPKQDVLDGGATMVVDWKMFRFSQTFSCRNFVAIAIFVRIRFSTKISNF